MKHTVILLFCLALALHRSGAQPVFVDVSNATGIQNTAGSQGVAAGDFNNDGWDDLYVCNMDRKNQLYRNSGKGTFVEMAESAGVAVDGNSQTAVWGDINNDGYPDIFVANQGPLYRLFLNNGDETFKDITLQAGIFQTGHPFSVNMADVNRDGLLDIYISNFLLENTLYLNKGNNTFVNYTFQSKALDNGKSMGAVFFDYDNDGDEDLYLVHDGFQPNFLYRNDGKGIFTETAQSAGANTQSFGMGIDVGDINNDGFLDLYITNLYENILLRANGDGTFANISKSAGIEDYGMGWGLTFIDFDNDGWQDIYVANDYAFSPYPNVLYRNLGHSTFERAEVTGPVCNKYQSYGTATLDYDLDGFPDLVVANRGANEHLQLFQNLSNKGHWIGIKLQGKPSNRDAVGARIKIVDTLGIVHYRQVTAGHGWSSQNSRVLHFGLGEATALRAITVYWPSGLIQTIDPVPVDQYYLVEEGTAPKAGLQQGASSIAVEPKHPARLDFNIFPNPVSASGRLGVLWDGPDETPALLEIVDLSGKRLMAEILGNKAMENATYFIDSQRILPDNYSGVLFVRLTGKAAAVTKRLVVVPH